MLTTSIEHFDKKLCVLIVDGLNFSTITPLSLHSDNTVAPSMGVSKEVFCLTR